MTYLLVVFYFGGVYGPSYRVQHEFKTLEACKQHRAAWEKEINGNGYKCLEIKK